MKECVVYHWWSAEGDDPPGRNMRVPIIQSIATLRGCNADIPIYVLNLPGAVPDYGDWPSVLGFTVVPWVPTLDRYDFLGTFHLSRLFDCRRFAETIPETTILYCDTDVFWKANPLPLLQRTDRFAYNGCNSGFFYFDKKKISPRFWEIFEAYTITAVNDECFRHVSNQYSYSSDDYFVFDESILGYMWVKHPDLFRSIDHREHCRAQGLAEGGVQPGDIRMLHANGLHVENTLEPEPWKRNYARGLVPLVIEDFYRPLARAVDPTRIYTPEQISAYAPMRVGLTPSLIESCRASLTGTGLIDLMRAIRAFHQGVGG